MSIIHPVSLTISFTSSCRFCFREEIKSIQTVYFLQISSFCIESLRFYFCNIAIYTCN